MLYLMRRAADRLYLFMIRKAFGEYTDEPKTPKVAKKHRKQKEKSKVEQATEHETDKGDSDAGEAENVDPGNPEDLAVRNGESQRRPGLLEQQCISQNTTSSWPVESTSSVALTVEDMEANRGQPSGSRPHNINPFPPATYRRGPPYIDRGNPYYVAESGCSTDSSSSALRKELENAVMAEMPSPSQYLGGGVKVDKGKQKDTTTEWEQFQVVDILRGGRGDGFPETTTYSELPDPREPGSQPRPTKGKGKGKQKARDWELEVIEDIDNYLAGVDEMIDAPDIQIPVTYFTELEQRQSADQRKGKSKSKSAGLTGREKHFRARERELNHLARTNSLWGSRLKPPFPFQDPTPTPDSSAEEIHSIFEVKDPGTLVYTWENGKLRQIVPSGRGSPFLVPELAHLVDAVGINPHTGVQLEKRIYGTEKMASWDSARASGIVFEGASRSLTPIPDDHNHGAPPPYEQATTESEAGPSTHKGRFGGGISIPIVSDFALAAALNEFDAHISPHGVALPNLLPHRVSSSSRDSICKPRKAAPKVLPNGIIAPQPHHPNPWEAHTGRETLDIDSMLLRSSENQPLAAMHPSTTPSGDPPSQSGTLQRPLSTHSPLITHFSNQVRTLHARLVSVCEQNENQEALILQSFQVMHELESDIAKEISVAQKQRDDLGRLKEVVNKGNEVLMDAYERQWGLWRQCEGLREREEMRRERKDGKMGGENGRVKEGKVTAFGKKLFALSIRRGHTEHVYPYGVACMTPREGATGASNASSGHLFGSTRMQSPGATPGPSGTRTADTTTSNKHDGIESVAHIAENNARHLKEGIEEMARLVQEYNREVITRERDNREDIEMHAHEDAARYVYESEHDGGSYYTYISSEDRRGRSTTRRER